MTNFVSKFRGQAGWEAANAVGEGDCLALSIGF